MEFSLLPLFAVLLIAWSAGLIANRLGFPAILGELAAGIVFGPAMLGAVGLGFSETVPGLSVLAQVGVFALMLYIGMEVNYRDLLAHGRAGFLGAVGGFVVPFGAGFALAMATGLGATAGVFLGLAMGVTSLATKSRILADLDLFNTRIASVLLSGALLSDVAALVVFALALGLASEEGLRLGHLVMVVVRVAAYLVVAAIFGVKGLPWLGALVARLGLRERTGNFTFVLLIGLIYAEIAHLMGLHPIVGAFLAGVFLRDGVLKRGLSHEISLVVRDMSLGFLAPVFFFTVGFHVRLNIVWEQPLLVASILVLASVTKVIGTAVFYSFSGNGWREGVVIGAGMNGRGAVEIIVAEIGLALGLIDASVFSTLVLMAFFTTLLVPPTLRWGVDWLRKRGELVQSDDERSGVVLVGAGALPRLVAGAVQGLGLDPVCLVDTNSARCERARRQGLHVVQGSVMREEVMILAGAEKARVLLALTTNDAVNSAACRTARERFRIPHVLARPSGDGGPLLDGHGKATPVWPPGAAAGQLSVWERAAEARSLDAVESTSGAESVGATPEGQALLPLCMVRNGRLVMPPPLDDKPGDRLVCLRNASKQAWYASRFKEAVARAPVLEFDGAIPCEDLYRRASTILAPHAPVEADELANLLIRREAEFPSVLAPGLAIPHLALPGEGGFWLLMARSRPGFTFPRSDEPTSAVFLLLGDENDREMHLHALAGIAAVAARPDFQENWLQAGGMEDLREWILGLL